MIAFNFFKTLYIPYQTFETVFTTPVCPMSYVMYHLSCVMCHMSCVICHISQVTCHMSYVTCHKSHVKKKNMVELPGGGSVINGPTSSSFFYSISSLEYLYYRPIRYKYRNTVNSIPSIF